MICKALALVVLLSVFDAYDCGDLKIKIEDVFIDYVNYTYIDEETFYCTVDYETETKSSISTRIDIIKEIPEDIHVKIKVWGRSFGQYNLPTGINLDVKFCNGNLEEFIRPFRVGTGLTCPPEKGTYENHDITTEIVGLPISLLPGLHLMIETEIYAPGITISKARAYVFIS